MSALSLSELEMYVLSNVLCWRVSFPTPSDFIAHITREMMEKPSTPSCSMTAGTVERARYVTELLLLCTPTSGF